MTLYESFDASLAVRRKMMKCFNRDKLKSTVVKYVMNPLGLAGLYRLVLKHCQAEVS